MSKRWYLVENHLGSDYWKLVDESDPHQEEEIEEVCEICFDSDWIIGTAGALEEARALCGAHYNSDYGRDMYQAFAKLLEASK